MNKVKEIKLDNTNWLEVTWVTVETVTLPQEELEDGVVNLALRTQEVETIIHCESFGDSDEYIALLHQRCNEFGVELSEDNLIVLDTQVRNRHVPTVAELKANEDRLALIAESMKEQEAYEVRKAAMLAGKEYNGYLISFTKDDGDGVVQVKSAFEMGLDSTIISFDCGTKMPINSSQFSDFALWFAVERDKFFKVN